MGGKKWVKQQFFLQPSTNLASLFPPRSPFRGPGSRLSARIKALEQPPWEGLPLNQFDRFGYG